MIRIAPLEAGFLLAGVLSAQTAISVLVGVEGQKNAPPPKLTASDVSVEVGHQHSPVTAWSPVRERQLWMLIDDGSNINLGLQLEDMRRFIESQLPSTQIAIGYMDHGTVEVAQPFTADHAAAAKVLRVPRGMPGIAVSPYMALQDLIEHKWPASGVAREVLMVSSGIDTEYGAGMQNPYLQSCLDTAQRAGIAVYAIYFPAAGHLGHSYWEEYWGQNYLAQLTDETGGEFYWLGYTAPVSLQPYLSQLSERLSQQFILTFQCQGRPGFQRLRLTTEIPHASLVSQSRVYVPKMQ